MDSLLIYGSYGYTGRLVAREAVSRGGAPAIAGRDDEAVVRQADDLGVEGRSFDLGSADLPARIGEFDAVLNCAGPFADTAVPLVDACLETGTDYLDITGEVPVFERLRRRDEAARSAGVTLLPGVGFDVVPSDCLAAFLHEHLPSADELALGVDGALSFSRGTARTLVEQFGRGIVRQNGRLVEVPVAYRSREIDFGSGPKPAVTVPWPDVVTAAHTTGIETVEVYAAVPGRAKPVLPIADALGWLVERRPIERLVKRAIDRAFDGPDGRELATGTATVWGEVRETDTGRTARGRVRTPNPYSLTAESAVSAAERVLAGDARIRAGFQTPANAFGSEFVLDLAGTSRELVEVPSDEDRTKLERSVAEGGE
ncbi:saccharopine dehydrogenase family protein [Halosolutus gelatinilyticus]|uniref:saccharopine dehydrogenase family protein n=1 Tax=Halosolutus gelatinilyticus TaxID=2931975 RepID=UPI001FF1157B|nr:saccharopine dehydrogenase NADP-binding domain-containing protein [Halosolutus gelatinilyticus]